MAMDVHEQTDLVCTQKWRITFPGFRQQWRSRYHHYETVKHSARDTDAHLGSACLPPGCVMGSWNAVMEVMKRAAGDTYNTNFP